MKQLLSASQLALLMIVFGAPAFSQNIASKDLVDSYKQYLNVVEYAPVATNDYITINRAQSIGGNVLANDYDPAGKSLIAYLVSGSANGTVDLKENGDFSFSPNKDFSGSSATFTYKVCNNSLCSETATVTISFPKESMIPVMLVDFMATYKEDNNVAITWTTSFENNLDRFEIERSNDGEHFTTVGTVKGHGTTNLTNNYVFNYNVNRQTVTKNDIYFRLKQVTADNRTANSKVLVVRIYKTKALQLVSVTPNPAVNDIKVNVQLNENSYVVAKVLNKDGSELFRKTFKSDLGTNIYTLDGTSRLDKGMYFLEMIVNSNERMLVKLLKD